jgi:ketol-acid reductoisomerase
MASKTASRALRASLRQLQAPQVQQRTFVSAVNASKAVGVRSCQKATTSAFVQQTRGKKTVDFAGDKEVVYGM